MNMRDCLLFSIAVMSTIVACNDAANPEHEDDPGVESDDPIEDAGVEAAFDEVSLYETYTDYFEIGVALEKLQLDEVEELVTYHFNRLTHEDSLKFGNIHPREDEYFFDDADIVADYARERGIKMTGHTLIWHWAMPSWPDDKSQDELTTIMEDHIHTVVGRYHDVVDNWDVLNEALSDDNSKLQREEYPEYSWPWYERYGDHSYMYKAFIFAEEALEANNAEALLFYNDYNCAQPAKVERILEFVEWLKENGARVDGIGFQGHWGMTYPTPAEIRGAIETYVAAGLKVKISELDINVYDDFDDDGNLDPVEEPVEYTEELAERQAARYAELFEVFREFKNDIIHVTLWGVSDKYSWYPRVWPVVGRVNYPLLFDYDNQPKEAFFAVVDF